MRKGKEMTTSGWPLASDADMLYHRLTGDQVPKGVGPDVVAPMVLDCEVTTDGRLVSVTVDSTEGIEALGLPDYVHVESVDRMVPTFDLHAGSLSGHRFDGVILDTMAMVAMSASAAAAAGTEMHRALEQGTHEAFVTNAFIDDPHMLHYDIETAEGLSFGAGLRMPEPIGHTYDHYDGARWDKWKARARQTELRVGKNRAANRAARKARKNNRRK